MHITESLTARRPAAFPSATLQSPCFSPTILRGLTVYLTCSRTVANHRSRTARRQYAWLSDCCRLFSSRPPRVPAERETECEWRDPESACTTMLIQGIRPRLCH